MSKAKRIPNVRYNLKSHDPEKQKNDDLLIFLVFRFNGNKLLYSTGEVVKPKYWNSKTQRPKSVSNHREYSDVSIRLNELENICKKIYVEFDNGNISIEKFKEELSYRTNRVARPTSDDGIPSFVSFFEDYIEERKRTDADDGQKRTTQKFATTLKHFKDYQKYIKAEINYNDIDWNFIEGFENWFVEKTKVKSQNTIAKYFQTLMEVFRIARRKRYHINTIDSEKGFTIKRVKTKRKARLDFKEIETLIDLDLSKHHKSLEEARDLFIVGCFTGLRFSDWSKVGRNHIIEEEGQGLLEIMTYKTKAVVYIPL